MKQKFVIGVGHGMGSAGLGLVGVLVLSACGQRAAAPTELPVAPPSQAMIDYAETARPADAALASIYERSCMACHALPGTGAPLTGHTAAWTQREERVGKTGLLQATKQGLNAMPAMGLCNDCSDDDFLALIEFMTMGEDG